MGPALMVGATLKMEFPRLRFSTLITVKSHCDSSMNSRIATMVCLNDRQSLNVSNDNVRWMIYAVLAIAVSACNNKIKHTNKHTSK